MSRFLIFFLFILQIGILVQCNGLYSVVAPGTLRSKSDYHVTVSIHDAPSPCKVKVGLTGPAFDKSETIEVPPKSSKTLLFQIPKLTQGDYKLIAEGISGIIFKNTTYLNYAADHMAIYVQTDKAKYKPNDKVQYRVLVLDKNTRPAKIDGAVNITINDEDQNLIKKLNDVELTKGVFSGELQLSEFPVFGKWQINVSADNTLETKTFDVEKYVLPKFEVQVNVPKHVGLADEKILATISSIYTYGKPVKGKAVVSVKPSDNDDGQHSAEKTIKIDGKGHVEFDISKDLQLNKENYHESANITIMATVEEELTGFKHSSSVTIALHDQKYNIESVMTPSSFFPGKPVIIEIFVMNHDRLPVQDIMNPVTLIVSRLSEDEPFITKSQILSHEGIAKFEIVPPADGTDYLSVDVSYLDSKSSQGLPKIDKPVDESLKVTVQTKNPALGKDVSILVENGKPIPYFIYTVVGRGDILQSGFIQVPQNRNYHVFKITPTFEMIPHAKMFIHFIVASNLYYAEKTIKFKKDFENSISIEAPVEVKPGANVNIEVATDPDSYVGLLGVDQSVLLLKSGNDLDKNTILQNLDRFDSSTPLSNGNGQYPGVNAGLLTMSNANYNFIQNSSNPARESGCGKKIRKEFPETWMFESLINTDGKEITLHKKVPDTITSWVITGFSLNSKSGLAITDEATKLRVFKPFFISTNLPYSVKRGEIISIPVVIFNYLNQELDAEVILDKSNREFDFIEATNEVTETAIDYKNRTKHLTIASNSGKSISFLIRPNKVGPMRLKISAVSPLAGDIVIHNLKVEPEGITIYKNKAILLKLNEGEETKLIFDVEIPENSVKDSVHIELGVVGDAVLGLTIKNLDKLIRQPSGCGEQNMYNFVPDILVLKHLSASKQLTPELEKMAKQYLSLGYQLEIQYKQTDGSFSTFIPGAGSGSTWLTAYVVKSFHQAIPYTDIDPKIIEAGLKFLADNQLPSGEFKTIGRTLYITVKDGPLDMSAYVLLAFLENTESYDNYKDVIEKGLSYLERASTDDQYSLAKMALALALGKRKESAKKILIKLDGLAKVNGDYKWWSVGSAELNIETTAYIVLAKLNMGSAESVLPCFKWLLSQRNSNGGFYSTQDTVIALEALSKFAEKGGIMNIDFTAGSGNSGTFEVTPENALTLQTHVLPNTVRKIEIKGRGTGSSLVQVSYRYNTVDKNAKPRFNVMPVVQKSPKGRLSLVVCTEFITLDDEKESNMALMEVELPSGYAADANCFDKVKEVERVKRVETKNSKSMVIIYFESLGAQQTCVTIEAIKLHAVAKQKPASITVYDYYDNIKRNTEYYEVKSSLCDICVSEDCGPGC